MDTNLPKVITKKKKRVGRGYGSGKGGHTVGRGTKGQKSRTKVGILFEGIKAKKSLLRRLPQLRGKDKFKSKPSPRAIKLSELNVFPVGSKVNLESLVKSSLFKKTEIKNGVKILADKGLKKRLIVELPVSKKAAKEIEKLKGKVVQRK